MMKKWMIVFFLLFFTLLSFSPALADANGFCDPVPDSLTTLLDSDPNDCVVFSAPDGTTRVFLILDEGWSLKGYTQKDGQWIRDVDSTPMEGYRDVHFVRHQAGQLRPDGSAYMDDQGFDVVSKSGPYQSFHWSGEYYTLCGWSDPDRYLGTVMIDGTVIRYFPDGSRTPEYMVDVGDELTLYDWTWNFETLPATPENARKRAAILPDAIRSDFPGYELVERYNSSTMADAVFAQVAEDKEKGGVLLRIIKATYTWDKGQTHVNPLMDIPLSDRLRDISATVLWTDMHKLFTQCDALDTVKVPLPGRIVDLHPQKEQLVLVVEDEDENSRAVIVTQDENRDYHLALSPILPKGSSLDDFHAGENEIILYLGGDSFIAGYVKQADGAWRLSWVMSETDYVVYWWGVKWDDHRLIGALEGSDLFTANFSAIPGTEEALKKNLDAAGWAAVNNPNPKDRLHLRTRPDKKADSLGKFYNGTPVRVLETKGNWCRVAIGIDGLEGWMMKQYLAFSQNANAVEPVFPDLFLREEYEDRDLTAWADSAKKIPKTLSSEEDWEIMGVMNDLYILVSRSSGAVVYAPMDWFWEGNG
ncbi:MAG: SH3 domain-containing protein [Clostridia bacterium]|nr:SH3 domain-containing protein [Clostridia bacterium]